MKRIAVMALALTVLASGWTAADARADARACGVGLVAGMAGCLDWKMTVLEYQVLARVR